MGVPNWVSKNHEKLWKEPWTVDPDPRKSAAFKKSLWDHGLISPNFTRAEGASRQYSGKVVQIPDNLRTNAQRHCFKLERVRHAMGDGPLAFVDMYRDPVHNAETGGVIDSEHLYADASDWNASGKLKAELEKEFAQGGIGTGAVSGNVQHVDDGVKNGGPRRWTYANR